MYVIYKTEHGNDSKPTFIPGHYTSRDHAQEDMAFYARQEFAKALKASQQLSEKFGPLVDVHLDVDSVYILDASFLKPAAVEIEKPAVETTEMQSEATVVVDEELESESLVSDDEQEEEEEEQQKYDLNSQLICNHAMIYRNDAETSIDVIRLTEKRERRFLFFTKVVHVPEPLVSFVIAEVPTPEQEAPQEVLDTFEENRSTLLTSMIEYDR